MNEAFKKMLSAMSDHEINALDASTLDESARESLAIEVANRNRANEAREIEEAIERGATTKRGNAAPRKALYLAIGIAAAVLFWIFN